MSFHIDTLFSFRANQSLLFLLKAACLSEKQQIPILLSLVWPNGARTHDLPHWRWALYYPTDAVVFSTKLVVKMENTVNDRKWTRYPMFLYFTWQSAMNGADDANFSKNLISLPVNHGSLHCPVFVIWFLFLFSFTDALGWIFVVLMHWDPFLNLWLS
jgi:hypothetical protein